MSRTRSAYTPEFRRQMVDLVRAGRSPEELAKEFHERDGWEVRAGYGLEAGASYLGQSGCARLAYHF